MQRFDDTGFVDPLPTNDGHAVKLTDFDQFTIIESVLDNPAVYLKEIRQNIQETSGIVVAESTICRYLHKSGFSCQKLAQVAKQRSAVLKGQHSKRKWWLTVPTC